MFVLWFIWLHICSLSRIPVFPGCHQGHTCHKPHFAVVEGFPRGTKESLVWKAWEIPCKPHALKCSIKGVLCII